MSAERKASGRRAEAAEAAERGDLGSGRRLAAPGGGMAEGLDCRVWRLGEHSGMAMASGSGRPESTGRGDFILRRG